MMETNEENTSLALQILAMVDQGCMLQLNEYLPMNLVVPVGYAEIWLDRQMMFYVEMSDLSTGHQHILRFANFEVRSNQVLFYNQRGKITAALAPFIEWPEVNTDEMHEAWAQWQQELRLWARAQAARQARQWRHVPLGGDEDSTNLP